jgi:hypothetical protein
MTKPEEMVHPYCGGCGHRFFREMRIPAAQTDEEAKTRRCEYCLDEMKADLLVKLGGELHLMSDPSLLRREDMSATVDLTMQKEKAFCFFLVKTDHTNPRHHGLRTNTSPYLITAEPGPGDQIAARFDGQIRWRLRPEKSQYADEIPGAIDWQMISAEAKLHLDDDDAAEYVVASHPGRGPSLGEDMLEDAFGQPVMADLLREYLEAWCCPAERNCWRYAPVVAEKKPQDERLYQLVATWVGPWPGEWTVRGEAL